MAERSMEHFLKNKYTKIYFDIINRAATRDLPLNEYVEKHHIIPKSLSGSNKKSNLVKLTPKEHFVCHRLLVKMTQGKDKVKMSYAIRCLMIQENEYQQRYKINSSTYARIIAQTRKTIGEAQTGKNNPFFKKNHTIKTKKIMKENRALQVMATGWSHCENTKEKLRKAHKEQFKDPEQKEMRRAKSRELWQDENYRNNRKSNAGRAWYFHPKTYHSVLCYPMEKPAGYVKGRKIKGGGYNGK